jgi:ABC-type lipoprotein export system ATPase subunit
MQTITIHKLTKSFTQGKVPLTVLNGVTARFEQGTSVAITGASGSGKSTLLHLLAALDQPDSGTIEYDGKNVGQMSNDERQQYLNQKIGLVFQQPYLIEELSVLENVMLKGLVAGGDAEKCREQARGLLAKVGLSEKAEELPTTLSGGQQQRVAIARALYGSPSFIFADEPTGNLDRVTGKTVIDLLLQVVRAQGTGLIMVSHDAYVEQVVDQVWHLNNGVLERVK